MKAEIITLEGKSFAILPLKAYESLVDAAEEMDDIRTFDAAMARKEESFPDTIVEQMIAGENMIAVFRKYRKLSQEQLAKKAGITRAYVAALETGGKQGSVKVLKSIAKALSVDLDLIC